MILRNIFMLGVASLVIWKQTGEESYYIIQLAEYIHSTITRKIIACV
jgi:hypothetical protein